MCIRDRRRLELEKLTADDRLELELELIRLQKEAFDNNVEAQREQYKQLIDEAQSTASQLFGIFSNLSQARENNELAALDERLGKGVARC